MTDPKTDKMDPAMANDGPERLSVVNPSPPPPFSNRNARSLPLRTPHVLADVDRGSCRARRGVAGVVWRADSSKGPWGGRSTRRQGESRPGGTPAT